MTAVAEEGNSRGTDIVKVGGERGMVDGREGVGSRGEEGLKVRHPGSELMK